MKNFKIMLAVVVFGITTLISTSCQQNNPAPQAVPVNGTQMIGNWKFDFTRNITYIGSGNPIVITDSTIYDTPSAGQTYEVTLTQFIMSIQGVPNVSAEDYTLSGNTIIFPNTGTYTIKVLDQTNMVLRKTISSTQFSERHYTRL